VNNLWSICTGPKANIFMYIGF